MPRCLARSMGGRVTVLLSSGSGMAGRRDRFEGRPRVCATLAAQGLFKRILSLDAPLSHQLGRPELFIGLSRCVAHSACVSTTRAHHAMALAMKTFCRPPATRTAPPKSARTVQSRAIAVTTRCDRRAVVARAQEEPAGACCDSAAHNCTRAQQPPVCASLASTHTNARARSNPRIRRLSRASPPHTHPTPTQAGRRRAPLRRSARRRPRSTPTCQRCCFARAAAPTPSSPSAACSA